MSTELERDITEIKVSVARIEEKFKLIESHVATFIMFEERLRILENYKSKANGYAAAIGAVAGFITAIIIKLL